MFGCGVWSVCVAAYLSVCVVYRLQVRIGDIQRQMEDYKEQSYALSEELAIMVRYGLLYLLVTLYYLKY